MSPEGKTLVLSVAFLRDETMSSFQFALKSFVESVDPEPTFFMIERCSALRDAFKKDFPQI